jgi:hypothetical protein
MKYFMVDEVPVSLSLAIDFRFRLLSLLRFRAAGYPARFG